jgi:hypothetical protein
MAEKTLHGGPLYIQIGGSKFRANKNLGADRNWHELARATISEFSGQKPGFLGLKNSMSD